MSSPPLPSVDTLRCFVAVAEQLSFRRAAQEVGLTAAALSQRIKQLEEMLERQLFERSSRHVALTLAGTELLGRARLALAALQSCAQSDEAARARLPLIIGTRFELGLSYLVPVVSRLAMGGEPRRIHLAFGSGPEILERLERGTVDGIVTSAPVADARWAAQVLHAEAYVLVAAPELLARRPLDRPSDGLDHVLLDLDNDLPLARYALSACPGLSFGEVWRLGTAAAVCMMARAGHGVAAVPEYMVRGDLAAGSLVCVLPEVQLLSDTFRLLYRRESPLAESLATFAECLRREPLR